MNTNVTAAAEGREIDEDKVRLEESRSRGVEVKVDTFRAPR